MNHPTRIVLQLIDNHFPELKKTYVNANYKKIDYNIEFGEYHGGGYHIEINTRLKRAPLIVLRGGLAHELAHMIQDARLPFPLINLDDWLAGVSRRYRIRTERATDLIVVRRGLAQEILAFNRWAYPSTEPWDPERGVSPKELKGLVKV